MIKGLQDGLDLGGMPLALVEGLQDRLDLGGTLGSLIDGLQCFHDLRLHPDHVHPFILFIKVKQGKWGILSSFSSWLSRGI